MGIECEEIGNSVCEENGGVEVMVEKYRRMVGEKGKKKGYREKTVGVKVSGI